MGMTIDYSLDSDLCGLKKDDFIKELESRIGKKIEFEKTEFDYFIVGKVETSEGLWTIDLDFSCSEDLDFPQIYIRFESSSLRFVLWHQKTCFYIGSIDEDENDLLLSSERMYCVFANLANPKFLKVKLKK